MQRGFNGRRAAGWGLAVAFVGALAFASHAQSPDKAAKTKAAAKAKPGVTALGLSPEDKALLTARFEKEIWPLMARGDGGCVACHTTQNASQFLMLKDAAAAFQKMLGEGHFDPDNHASLIERITTSDKAIKMPPTGLTPWTPAEIASLTAFAEEVQKRRQVGGVKPDEAFPFHLQSAYTGAPHVGGPDNTFLSFRQLRGKIQSIFNDDWRREDRDLFIENLHLFGGADFVRRYDETTKASPTFLTGVEMMARDVASRSYLSRTGPFAGHADALPSPLGMKAPSAAYAAEINRIYQRMLFRDATAAEVKEAFRLLQAVYKAQSGAAATAPQDLRFALTVRDDRGMKTTQDITVRVTADARALYQEFVDQSKATASQEEKALTASHRLGGTFTFVPGDAGQKVEITNAGTHGNVSVQGITLRGPLPATTEKTIAVDHESVRAEGAWRIRKDGGITTYEDGNENKGDSLLTFPITVAQRGKYTVSVTWRRFQEDTKDTRRRGPASPADNVRVEVVSADKQSRLALPPAPPVPPKGEAHFFVDQTVDNIAFSDLRTAFQFGPGDGIEIRNDGTRKRVVADAVRLLPADTSDTVAASAAGTASALLIRGADAVGKEKWPAFQKGTFRPYNTTGPDIFQDTDDSGKKEGLSLLYKPEVARKEGWNPARFYRVGVGFPGQVNNDSRVPVIVKGRASSPIVQIVYPDHAHVGATLTIDASSTFNLQRSPLTFTWTQTGGPRVALKNPAATKLAFTAPSLGPKQAAWEGLCRALMAHPDFLFTRPRSLASITDPKQRRRLQLVKIAQDLVGRTPSEAELKKLESGASLAQMIDGYMASQAFRDFYFHRVRLYLESQGTEMQDEPVRLWSYIAFNDRPFQEILTADYTVDTGFQKQTRPVWHGKTGLLTMKGFIQGKPGLPHFNYPAQVTQKFLGYVFEVPAEVVEAREGITAAATTDPKSVCYSCHKVLTPLAYQRGWWDDDGNFRQHDDTGLRVDATDRALVASYPYKGDGMEAFAVQAQNKERFIRTILQTHFVWYFGRELRFDADERGLYKRLWDVAADKNYALRPIIKTMLLSPEYLNGTSQTPPAPPTNRLAQRERLEQYHESILRPAPSRGKVLLPSTEGNLSLGDQHDER